MRYVYYDIYIFNWISEEATHIYIISAYLYNTYLSEMKL